MKLPMQNYHRREVANKLEFLARHHDDVKHDIVDVPRGGLCHRFILSDGNEISLSAESGRFPTRSKKQKIQWDKALLSELGRNFNKRVKDLYTNHKGKEMEGFVNAQL